MGAPFINLQCVNLNLKPTCKFWIVLSNYLHNGEIEHMDILILVQTTSYICNTLSSVTYILDIYNLWNLYLKGKVKREELSVVAFKSGTICTHTHKGELYVLTLKKRKLYVLATQKFKTLNNLNLSIEGN